MSFNGACGVDHRIAFTTGTRAAATAQFFVAHRDGHHYEDRTWTFEQINGSNIAKDGVAAVERQLRSEGQPVNMIHKNLLMYPWFEGDGETIGVIRIRGIDYRVLTPDRSSMRLEMISDQDIARVDVELARAGWDVGPRLRAGIAQKWVEAELSSVDAHQWVEAGVWELDHVLALRAAGIEPSAVTRRMKVKNDAGEWVPGPTVGETIRSRRSTNWVAAYLDKEEETERVQAQVLANSTIWHDHLTALATGSTKEDVREVRLAARSEAIRRDVAENLASISEQVRREREAEERARPWWKAR